MDTVVRNALPLALALVASGCAADTVTTLEELAAREDRYLEATVERDVCNCSCGKPVCWDFSCTGSGCSSADEYQLALGHGPGEGECFDDASGVRAVLVAGTQTVEPHSTSGVCGGLAITWRALPDGIDFAQDHRVELIDDSATWTIDRPFAQPAAIIVAPESAAVAGSPRALHPGDQLLVEWSEGVDLVAPRATLASAVRTGSAPPAQLEVARTDAAIEIRVPSETAPGLYDLTVAAATVLAAHACAGPAQCRGLALHASWQLRVE